MPVVMGTGYIACIYFFLTMQRGTKNFFERVMCFASAGVFILPLMRLICAAVRIILPLPIASEYAELVLAVIATVAIVARTIEIFISNRKVSQAAP
jgi:hypothetical protein